MQSVTRIVQIMRGLAEAPDGLTLSEVARGTKLPPATAHRLLGALHESSLVERDEVSKRWRTGDGVALIAASLTPTVGFADSAIGRLRDRWQECFYLSALSDGEVVCVHSTATSESHRVKVHVPLGRRFPLHSSAAAKAILAHLPTSQALELLRRQPLTRFTEHTIVDVDEVAADLRFARTLEHAICDQEMELGVNAMAVAIPGPPGEPHRSLGVIGPRERILADTRHGLLEDLLETAHEIAPRLGGGGVLRPYAD
jgi:IclR family acetate operon transcriptional repressor